MKYERKEAEKQLWCIGMRLVALLICICILVSSGGHGWVTDWNQLQGFAVGFAEAEQPVYDAGNHIYKVSNAAQLLGLSQMPPADYQTATIEISGGQDSYSDLINTFQGLGGNTPETAFAGTLRFADGASLYLYANHALFNYISDSAQLVSANAPYTTDTNMQLSRVFPSDAAAPALLAEHVVHAEGYTGVLFDTLKLIVADIDSNNVSHDVSPQSYGGIIGTIDDGCKVNLNVKNESVSDVARDGTVGVVCGSIGAGAELTLNYQQTSDTEGRSVTATGHAGGLVGEMLAGASLTVEGTYTYKGNVTAAGDAGGLIGYMGENAIVSLDAGTFTYAGTIETSGNGGGLVGKMEAGATCTVGGDYAFTGTVQAAHAGGLVGDCVDEALTITGTTSITGSVLGSQYAGGLAGYAVYHDGLFRTEAASDLVLNGLLLSGTTCGSMYGMLVNGSTAGDTILLANRVASSQVLSDGSCYGGLVGCYQAASLADALVLKDVDVTMARNGKVLTHMGGLVGMLDGGSTGCYVQLTGSNTVNASGTARVGSATKDNASIECFGGIIADAGAQGNFVDLAGDTLTIVTDAAGFYGTVESGGLVGSMTNGVLRLNQAVNLHAAKPSHVGYITGQLLGYRENTLVYADADYALTRCETVAVDDIGQWGEVVWHAAVGGDDTFELDDAAHTVTVAAADTEISDVPSFARLALNMQLNTQGNIGALRFTGTQRSAALLAGNLTVAGDISLAQTGLTGLTRDDGTNAEFSGTLQGKDDTDYTITLAIGDVQANGMIYAHSHSGLLAKASNATIRHLILDGNMRVSKYATTSKQYAGGLIAEHTAGTLQIEDVTAAETIRAKDGMPAGGLLGLSTEDNVIFGKEDGTGQVTIRCWIYVPNQPADASSMAKEAAVGGLMALTNGGTVTLNQVATDGMELHASLDKKGKVGGFLGYAWLNTNVYVRHCFIGKTTDATPSKLVISGNNANLDGLLYQASGYIRVEELDFGKAEITVNTRPDSFAVLVNDGKELYLEVANDDYYGCGGLTVNFNTEEKMPVVFDEFVAFGNKKDDVCANDNGVVSLPTSDRNGIDETGSNIYQNRMAGFEQAVNQYIRYYYNIDKILEKTTLTDGEQLLIWSIWHYSSACRDMFQNKLDESFQGNNIHGNCDLTGLSYYSINVPDNTTVTILPNTSIHFDNKAFTFNGVADASVKNNNQEKNQHYMMQRALFRDLKSTDVKSDVRRVNIRGKLTLSGAIGKMENNYTSGALFAGNVEGMSDGRTAAAAIINCEANCQIILQDLYVRGYTYDPADEETVSPLLIGRVGSYTNVNLVGVKLAEADSYQMGGQAYAATSLIGEAGYKDAVSVNLNFSGIALDARKQPYTTGGDVPNLTSDYHSSSAIFSHATLLESFRYGESSGSTGDYAFRYTEDWTDTQQPIHGVTYGFEITNSVEYAGKENRYLQSSIGVSPVPEKLVTDAAQFYAFNGTDFLPYVYHSPATYQEGQVDKDGAAYTAQNGYHELRINLSSANINEGCGTYGDPYRITSGAQLEALAEILESETFSPGFEVGYQADQNCQNAAAATHGVYRFVDDGFSLVTGADTVDNTHRYHKFELYQYLREAYYLIENDVLLSTQFKGIGSELLSHKIFRGVIVGKRNGSTVPTITIESQRPLINISGGAVVKDVNLVFQPKVQDATTNQLVSTPIAMEENTGGLFQPTDALREDSDKGCNYFGGVIGQLLAGDNIIDNVNVHFADGVQVALTGSKHFMVPVGAYVGVVRNGGLIFRNMAGKEMLTDAHTVGSLVLNADYLYVNPYVGRVLDGYVVTDDEGFFGDSQAMDNGEKNYSIVALKKPESEADKIGMTAIGNDKTAEKKPLNLSPIPKNTTFAWSTIQLPNAQSLFVLSAVVASGGCAYQNTNDTNGIGNYPLNSKTAGRNFGFFENTSYNIGHTRLAQYSDVGRISGGSADFALSQQDRDGYDYHVYNEMMNQDISEYYKALHEDCVPYLIRFYTQDGKVYQASQYKNVLVEHYPARLICSTTTRYSIALTNSTPDSDYTMPKGFRGVNAMFNNTSYSTNPDRQVINAFGFNGNGHSVTMQMHIQSYGEQDAYNPYGVGLFPRFQQNTSGQIHDDLYNAFNVYEEPDLSGLANLEQYKDWYAVRDLTLRGSLTYDVPETFGQKVKVLASESFVTKQTINDVPRVIVAQSVCVGGFTGRNYDSNGKYICFWFDNVALEGLTVSGGFSSGGVVGALGKFENNTYGFDGKQSVGGGSYVNAAMFSNITAENLSVNGERFAGGICGVMHLGGTASSVYYPKNFTVQGENELQVTRVTVEDASSAGSNACGGAVSLTRSPTYIHGVTITGNDTLIGGLASHDTGGIVAAGTGGKNYPVVISDCTVTGCRLGSNRTVGGILGDAESGTAASLTRCAVADCTISAQATTETFCGGIIGTVNLSAELSHISLRRCVLQSQSDNAINHDIGAMVGRFPISSVTLKGFDLLSDDTEFVHNAKNQGFNYTGNWVGRSEGGLVQLMAISKQGDPTKMLPYDVGKNAKHAEQYLVYADYLGAAAQDTPTPNETDGASPYVAVNPQNPAFASLPSMTEGSSDMENVTGDGSMLYQGSAVAKQILTEAIANANNKAYGNIGDANAKMTEFFPAGSEKDVVVFTFKDQLQTDDTAESNLFEQFTDAQNFPAILLQSGNLNDVTDLLRDYITLLTNESQLLYSGLAVRTYQLTEDMTWKRAAQNSLRVVGGDALQSVPGQYDNEKAQFTMVKVIFDSPVDETEHFYLYLPVIVKKVLQFKVTTRALSGTDYRKEHYEGRVDGRNLVENHGVPVTSMVTFTYYQRSYQEWLDSIRAGENYCWNFDKNIMFMNSVGWDTLPEGTCFTVVDCNNENRAYYGKIGDAGLFEAERNGQLNFAAMRAADDGETLFTPVPLAQLLCEQMALTATVQADGGFVKLANRDDATIMAYWNGEMAYFRPYSVELDGELNPQPLRYDLDVGVDGVTAGNMATLQPEINESYYVTLKTSKTLESLVSVDVCYPVTTLAGGQMATFRQEMSADRIILASFFEQQNFNFHTDSNELIENAASVIGAHMSVDLHFIERNRASFEIYKGSVGLYQGFVLSYMEYVHGDSGEIRQPQLVMSDTTVNGEYTVSYLQKDSGSEISEHRALTPDVIEKGCNQYLVKCPDANLSDALQDSDGTLTLQADVTIGFSLFDDAKFAAQFPSHESSATNDPSGLVVCCKSNISYSAEDDKLESSIVSTGNAEEDGYRAGEENANLKARRYYVTKSVSAKLVYDAQEEDTGDTLGRFTQLGINAKERNDMDKVHINAIGIYDASVLLEEPNADTLELEFRLEPKIPQERGYNGAFQGDITTYLQAFNVKVGDQTYTVRAEKNTYLVTVPDWQTVSGGTGTVQIHTAFDVLTGASFEAAGYLYSNYRLTLTASLMAQGERLTGSTDADHIVYTNCRICTDIMEMP